MFPIFLAIFNLYVDLFSQYLLDPHYPQLPPKTAAKPTNLMDSSQDSSKDLSLPLEPVSLNTVELRKPTGADKEWTSQNYMNVSVGKFQLSFKVQNIRHKSCRYHTLFL